MSCTTWPKTWSLKTNLCASEASVRRILIGLNLLDSAGAAVHCPSPFHAGGPSLFVFAVFFVGVVGFAWHAMQLARSMKTHRMRWLKLFLSGHFLGPAIGDAGQAHTAGRQGDMLLRFNQATCWEAWARPADAQGFVLARCLLALFREEDPVSKGG